MTRISSFGFSRSSSKWAKSTLAGNLMVESDDGGDDENGRPSTKLALAAGDAEGLAVAVGLKDDEVRPEEVLVEPHRAGMCHHLWVMFTATASLLAKTDEDMAEGCERTSLTHSN